MESFGGLLARKKQKVEKLERSIGAIELSVREYLKVQLGFESDIIKNCYLDNDRLVLILNHKAYASIIFAHKELITEKLRESGARVYAVTIL